MKPTRYTVIHCTTPDGRDVFSVARNARHAAILEAETRRAGYTVNGRAARFDFTLAQWGLSVTAKLEPNAAAAAAFRAKPATPRAPRAARAARTNTTTNTTRRGFAPPADPNALKFAALVALEEVVKVKFQNPALRTPDAAHTFETYQKCKALALNNPNANESAVALRQATLAIVKLAY